MKQKMSQMEFKSLCLILEEHTGIEIPAVKKDVVFSRLIGRIRRHDFDNFSQYIDLVSTDEQELSYLVDKLTTHETYFFREKEQFDFLHQYFQPKKDSISMINAWSAACASGQEAYSIAMILDDLVGENRWRVLGTDVSVHALSLAQKACYSMTEASRIPQALKQRYCLKGVGESSGSFMVGDMLKKQVRFSVDNLADLEHQFTQFDVIFLRNVLIYFSEKKQKQLLKTIIDRLAPNGLLFLGHAENFGKKDKDLIRLAPCIFQKGAY